ncbi:hypothetical protein, conserved [Eimeria brunetti]|uniref:Translation elongation factor KOW-like domain-containing protein n=1 Tax=Eimeria brunetti TaxID=51314 RepID=U6LN20_9EIME|nr:hypothetical protein, conserved [Eimeria brunetti]
MLGSVYRRVCCSTLLLRPHLASGCRSLRPAAAAAATAAAAPTAAAPAAVATAAGRAGTAITAAAATAAATAASEAAAAAGRWVRGFASITANEARQGSIILLDGRRVEVTEFRVIKTGRGAASISLSYIDLQSLKSGSQTFPVQKRLERLRG